MSTPNPQPGSAPVPAPAPMPPKPPHEQPKRGIVVISHCSLFYWWPVWAVGFLLFLITAFTGELLVTVPSGTHAKRDGATVPVEGKKKGDPKVAPLLE